MSTEIYRAETMNYARTFKLLAACIAALPLAGCLTPPRGMPDETVIGYDGHKAIAPDCEPLEHRSLLLDGGLPRPTMAWGCATYTNLAAQVANPRDFVAPAKLAPADAAVAASAVRRYETGRIIPLDEATSRSSK
ncbi:CpaD family pilus assembly lipoprotein [Burkholderia sp. PAMC 26561]|uniref:CpaD family pilus assembly lipoprotein n=1 Tax=Burkholderia sp. PAMC 26561 TaxID=1795043 RepID=UPI001F42212E|nr:CpaD family pilus assembly lipoprotein [Burkholderia sp. PAMC 26561]